MADAVLVSTLCLVAALCSALASFFIFVVDKRLTPPDKTGLDKLAEAEKQINQCYRISGVGHD